MFFLPYALWKFILEPKIKEPEFTASSALPLMAFYISLLSLFWI